MSSDPSQLLTNARELASQLAADVSQASTRLEHVRLTARANEAALLLQDLEQLLTGETNDVQTTPPGLSS
jgi:hypothetical protein